MGRRTERFETDLGTEQVRSALTELQDTFYVKWNARRQTFLIRKKVTLEAALARTPVNVKVRGRVLREADRTVVLLSPASAMGLWDTAVFALLTLLVLLYAGHERGMEWSTLLFLLLFITAFAWGMTVLFTRFAPMGKEMYADTRAAVIRNLRLQ